jgi:Raf kinase inhibitor-like YbhB/YbcL family protein
VRVVAAILAGVVAVGGGFRLSSPAFRGGARIPVRFTCDGADVSPPLRWTAPPRGTRSLALVVTDVSTPRPYTHWLVWGISPRARGLASGARPPREGRNDFGRRGYGGPCPPAGPAHRYVFRLYALRVPLRLAAGADVAAFRRALARQPVLTVATVARTYGR